MTALLALIIASGFVFLVSQRERLSSIVGPLTGKAPPPVLAPGETLKLSAFALLERDERAVGRGWAYLTDRQLTWNPSSYLVKSGRGVSIGLWDIKSVGLDDRSIMPAVTVRTAEASYTLIFYAVVGRLGMGDPDAHTTWLEALKDATGEA